MKIDLINLLQKREDDTFQLGMTLNKFATYCRPPKAWTFPWTHPFGGSIDYGDLSLHVYMDGGDLILNSLNVNMYDVVFDDDDEAKYVPKMHQIFSRACSVEMKQFVPGLTISQVESILDGYQFTFRRFGDVRATEIGAHIVVEEFAIFNFYREAVNPWLMSVNIFHPSHIAWPVSEGWK